MTVASERIWDSKEAEKVYMAPGSSQAPPPLLPLNAVSSSLITGRKWKVRRAFSLKDMASSHTPVSL